MIRYHRGRQKQTVLIHRLARCSVAQRSSSVNDSQTYLIIFRCFNSKLQAITNVMGMTFVFMPATDPQQPLDQAQTWSNWSDLKYCRILFLQLLNLLLSSLRFLDVIILSCHCHNVKANPSRVEKILQKFFFLSDMKAKPKPQKSITPEWHSLTNFFLPNAKLNHINKWMNECCMNEWMNVEWKK